MFVEKIDNPGEIQCSVFGSDQRVGVAAVCYGCFSIDNYFLTRLKAKLEMLKCLSLQSEQYFRSPYRLQITHSFLLDSSRQSLNRWRYTGLVGNLSFDPEILIICVSTSSSSPCFTSQRDWEIRGKICNESK